MKYKEIMDKIEVTPEMRQRVLQNVEAAHARKKKRALVRQIVSLAACVAIILCCWYAWQPRQQEQGMQAVPQIENVASISELSQKTGVPIAELTNLPFAVTETAYVSYWEELAEIQYVGEANTLYYRKSPGTEDNSGDYNTYGKEEALSVSGCTITLKGNDDGCSLATWTDGTYAYSISVATPISGEAFRSLLERNF